MKNLKNRGNSENVLRKELKRQASSPYLTGSKSAKKHLKDVLSPSFDGNLTKSSHRADAPRSISGSKKKLKNYFSISNLPTGLALNPNKKIKRSSKASWK